MIEYEYSFIVKDKTPYLEYCIKNKYKKEKEALQTRELFRNKNKILARITTDVRDEKEKIVVDFKDDNSSNVILKTSRETKPFSINNNDKEAIYSVLEILNFKKHKLLKRHRVVYQKDSVTFEIDSYIEPEKMFVVAIEGEKEAVDKVYEKLKQLIDKE